MSIDGMMKCDVTLRKPDRGREDRRGQRGVSNRSFVRGGRSQTTSPWEGNVPVVTVASCLIALESAIFSGCVGANTATDMAQSTGMVRSLTNSCAK